METDYSLGCIYFVYFVYLKIHASHVIYEKLILQQCIFCEPFLEQKKRTLISVLFTYGRYAGRQTEIRVGITQGIIKLLYAFHRLFYIHVLIRHV